jgi:CRISPR-associated endonuclease/helicase Cas3
VRFVVAAHDAGKLTLAWQDWAHEYQARMGEPVADDLLLAHTHYDASNEVHRAAERALPARPPHAAEGAAIVVGLAGRLLGDQRLARAAVSAIARHHSPATEHVGGDLAVHPKATAVLAGALAAVGVPVEAEAIPVPVRLEQLRFLARAGEGKLFLVYLLLVRALRLADQAAARGG